MIPKEGIRIFSSIFNAHLLAKQVRSEYYRMNDNGQSTLILNSSRDDYSFGIRKTDYYDNLVLYPGDSIINYCQYTSRRNISENGGKDIINQEMCLNVLSYYPVINGFEYCTVYQQPFVYDGVLFHDGLPLVQCGDRMLDYETGDEVISCTAQDRIYYEGELYKIYSDCFAEDLCSPSCLNRTLYWIRNPCIKNEGYDYFIKMCLSSHCSLIETILSTCRGICVRGKELNHCGSNVVKCVNNICSSSIQNSISTLYSYSHEALYAIAVITILITVFSIAVFFYFSKVWKGRNKNNYQFK